MACLDCKSAKPIDRYRWILLRLNLPNPQSGALYELLHPSIIAGRSSFDKIPNSEDKALPNFSLDLVEAAMRQSIFAKKITRRVPNLSDLRESGERYFQFMWLMKEMKSGLVPTLDIDLFWHTHQLCGNLYHSFCQTNVGRLIDHDDTLSPSVLSDGFKTTKIAWKENFGEQYLPSRKKSTKV